MWAQMVARGAAAAAGRAGGVCGAVCLRGAGGLGAGAAAGGLRRRARAADVTQAMAVPEVAERYKTLGYNRFDMKPDEFAQYIQKETQIWGKIISDAKLKLD